MNKKRFLIKLAVKIIPLVVLIALAAAAGWYLAKRITKVNLAMQENKKISYLLENRTKIDNQIQTDFSSVDPDYEQKIKSALPSIYNVLPFVEALESLAKKNSLQQTISFSQPVPAPEISGPLSLVSLDFNLNLAGGNIDTFTAYLKDFEKLPYFAAINNISLASSGGWENNSSISLSGRIYAQQ
jgi:hypothetical protein